MYAITSVFKIVFPFNSSFALFLLHMLAFSWYITERVKWDKVKISAFDV